MLSLRASHLTGLLTWLSGILRDVCSDMSIFSLPMPSDILCGMSSDSVYSGILPGTSSDVLSGIYFDILSSNLSISQVGGNAESLKDRAGAEARRRRRSCTFDRI